MTSETDDTVRLKGPRKGERSGFARFWPYAAGVAALAVVACAGAWWTLRPEPVAPPPQEAVLAPRPTARAPAGPAEVAVARPLPPLATESELLADAPDRLAVYRFAPQPAVLVLHFPTLGEQAQALNRLAALIEKQGFPHDRVLPHAELDSRIRATGGTPETFYYGHDYRSADVVRFFSLASELNPEEDRLQRLVTELGWHEHGALGALISLVRESAPAGLDATARAAILRHELSHGIYFTDPAYVEYCHRFWREAMTANERARFTAYLEKEGYDPALEDLIVNETQAYLIHTRDPRYFRASDVGLGQARADELRRIFIEGMPPGWLRDVDSATLPAGPALVPVRVP